MKASEFAAEVVEDRSAAVIDAALREDLDGLRENPVFRAMLQDVEDFEKQACEMEWIVLVPAVKSLPESGALNCSFSKSFLKQHVVQRSPYLKDEFVNYGGSRILFEELCRGEENSQTVIVLGKSENVADRIRVVSEETYVGSDGSFQVKRLERPLETLADVYAGIPESRVNLRFPEDGTLVFDGERPVEEWMFVLNRDKRNGPALRYLENYTEELQNSYVLVATKVGIADFCKKMNICISEAVKLLLENNSPRFGLARNNETLRSILRLAVEAYAALGMHEIVFDALVKHYHEEEIKLKMVLMPQRDVWNGVAERNSLEFWKELNARECPLAKLEYLRHYFRDASTGSNALLEGNQNVLETFTNRIVNIPQSFEPHVLANLHYMKSFHVSELPKDLNYLLYHLHAAVRLVGSNADEVTEGSRILSHPVSKIELIASSSTSGSWIGRKRTQLAPTEDTGHGQKSNKAVEFDVRKGDSRNEDGERGDLGGFLTALMQNPSTVSSSH